MINISGGLTPSLLINLGYSDNFVLFFILMFLLSRRLLILLLVPVPVPIPPPLLLLLIILVLVLLLYYIFLLIRQQQFTRGLKRNVVVVVISYEFDQNIISSAHLSSIGNFQYRNCQQRTWRRPKIDFLAFKGCIITRVIRVIEKSLSRKLKFVPLDLYVCCHC